MERNSFQARSLSLHDLLAPFLLPRAPYAPVLLPALSMFSREQPCPLSYTKTDTYNFWLCGSIEAFFAEPFRLSLPRQNCTRKTSPRIFDLYTKNRI